MFPLLFRMNTSRIYLGLLLFLIICAMSRSSDSPSIDPPRRDSAARAAGPPIIRYKSSEMTKELFTSHLSSGHPFIVNLPNPSTSKVPTTLDEWSESFSKIWIHSEPIMWNHRLSSELKDDYNEWEKAGNKISFDTFKMARERWPFSYLSIVANEPAEQKEVSKLFPTPSFISDAQKQGEAGGTWMYGKIFGVSCFFYCLHSYYAFNPCYSSNTLTPNLSLTNHFPKRRGERSRCSRACR